MSLVIKAAGPPASDCNTTTYVGRLVIQVSETTTSLWTCTSAGKRMVAKQQHDQHRDCPPECSQLHFGRRAGAGWRSVRTALCVSPVPIFSLPGSERHFISNDFAVRQLLGWQRISYCEHRVSLARLEEGTWKTGLTDDGLKSAGSQLGMIGYGDRPRRGAGPSLHYNVATTPTDLREPMLYTDQADVAPREDAQSTQRRRANASKVHGGRAGGSHCPSRPSCVSL